MLAVGRVRPMPGRIPSGRLGVGGQWRSPGAGSAPGQVYQPVPGFRAPVPAPASKAAAGSGPDADFVSLPKLGAREVWLSLLAPRAWAAAGLRNPSPAELTLGLSLVYNVNLPDSREFA